MAKRMKKSEESQHNLWDVIKRRICELLESQKEKRGREGRLFKVTTAENFSILGRDLDILIHADNM